MRCTKVLHLKLKSYKNSKSIIIYSFINLLIGLLPDRRCSKITCTGHFVDNVVGKWFFFFIISSEILNTKRLFLFRFFSTIGTSQRSYECFKNSRPRYHYFFSANYVIRCLWFFGRFFSLSLSPFSIALKERMKKKTE